MFKTAAVGLTALFVAMSPAAYAEDSSDGKQSRLSAAEPESITDLRIEVVKAALQLTPAQEKYWSAVEDAIRTRAKHREARLENIMDRVSDAQDSNAIELILNRNPVDRMHRRADALAQRSADLKKLADAWQPLYETLNADQKKRLALVRIIAFRAIANRVGGGSGMQSFDYDDEE